MFTCLRVPASRASGLAETSSIRAPCRPFTPIVTHKRRTSTVPASFRASNIVLALQFADFGTVYITHTVYHSCCDHTALCRLKPYHAVPRSTDCMYPNDNTHRHTILCFLRFAHYKRTNTPHRFASLRLESIVSRRLCFPSWSRSQTGPLCLFGLVPAI